MLNESTGLKVILAPSVYLVGSQEVGEGELSRFLSEHDVGDWTTDTVLAGQKLVEVAGRTCYMSFTKPRPGGNAAYIDHILDVGHGSVLEHAVFSFIITGVSRSLTHELVRHRAGMSYSMLSQRYVDESDVAFVVPPALIPAWEEFSRVEAGGGYDDDKKDDYWGGQRWKSAMFTAKDRYQGLSTYLYGKLGYIEDKTARRKAARESARSVLPNATETKIFVTANARALRHFIEMRASPHADAEIRRLAFAMLGILKREAWNLFGDYLIERSHDEALGVTTKNRKV